MKHTAVQNLANKIIELEERLRLKEITLNDFIDLKDELVEEAIIEEKEQIMRTAWHCHIEGVRQSSKTSQEYIQYAEQYYNETFKSE